MSMKKSLLLLVCVIAVVTIFSIVNSGGDSMQIDMNDTSITFSGIGDFKQEVAFEDISSVVLKEVPDWAVWHGDEFTRLHAENDEDARILFFTDTQIPIAVVLTLTDGSMVVFNYNNASNTEAIFNMLLKNLQ